MALILAIEPDARQAAQLTDVISRRVSAELVLADSTEHALAAIGDRVPDLVLIPMLLSPQEDAALAGALRAIAAAGRVQMLTIPVLAEAPKASRKRGVLAQFRRSRTASARPDGCDPSVFGDQIAAYLAEAALARTHEAPIDSPIGTVIAAAAGDVAADVDCIQAVAPAVIAPAVIEETPSRADAPGEIHKTVAVPVDEPLIIPLAGPIVVPIDLFAEALTQAEPIATPIDEPVMMAIEASITVALDEPVADTISAPPASVVEEAAANFDDDPIALQIQMWRRPPIVESIVDPIDEPISVLLDEPAASSIEEPAVYDLSLDEWTGDSASLMAINAMMLPVAETTAVSPSLVDQRVSEPEPPVTVNETVSVETPIAMAVEPPILAAQELVAVGIEPPVTVNETVSIEEPIAVAAKPPMLAAEEEAPVVVVEPIALAAEEPVALVIEPPLVVAPAARVVEPIALDAEERIAVVLESMVFTTEEAPVAVVEPMVRAVEEPVAEAIQTPVLASEEKRLSWSASRWRARWKNRLAVGIEPPVLAAKTAPVPVVEPELLAAKKPVPDIEPPVLAAEAAPVAAVAREMFATKELIPAVAEPPTRATKEAVAAAVEPPVLAALEPVAIIAKPVPPAPQPVAVVIEPPAPEAPLVTAHAAASIVAVPLDDDPGFFGAGLPATPAATAAAPAPPKPKRHEWVELVESLRLDLERRRIERDAQEAGARQESAPAATPAATTPRVVAPPPAKKVRRMSPLRGKSRKKPAQNEWGLFDPEQCGFAALLAKLDEITHAK